MALQPKVSKLSRNKRVICIYDTTTTEGSDDQASIEATPIDNRNSSTDAAHKQQQQLQFLQQAKQQLQLNIKQPAPAAAAAAAAADISGPSSGVLEQVLRRLDEVRALLVACGPPCQTCLQRVLNSDCSPGNATPAAATAAAAAAAAFNTSAAEVVDDDAASDSVSTSASPPVRNAHSSAAATLPAAVISTPPPSSPPRRKRTMRMVVPKRTAVPASKLLALKHAGAVVVDVADPKATEPDAPSNKQAPGGKQARTKLVIVKRRGKTGKQQQQQQQLLQNHDQGQAANRPTAAGQLVSDGNAERKSSTSARAKERQQRDAGGGVGRVYGGGCGATVGANGSNDHGRSGKLVHMSTVQELINKLQAVLCDEV